MTLQKQFELGGSSWHSIRNTFTTDFGQRRGHHHRSEPISLNAAVIIKAAVCNNGGGLSGYHRHTGLQVLYDRATDEELSGGLQVTILPE